MIYNYRLLCSFFLCIITSPLFSIALSPCLVQPSYTYLIKLKLPPHSQHLENWRILYKGDAFNFQGNIALLTEQQSVFCFSLVITPDIDHGTCAPSRGLHYLSLKPNEPVRWFDITLIFRNNAWRWQVVELSSDKIPAMLPHHAIIFLCNPALIKEIEHPQKIKYCLDGTYEGGRCTFEMPVITLDGSAEQIQNAHIQAQLATINMSTHHRQRASCMQVIDGISCYIDIT